MRLHSIDRRRCSASRSSRTSTGIQRSRSTSGDERTGQQVSTRANEAVVVHIAARSRDAMSADARVEVSFVMPCLNEAETLGRCIEKAQRAIEQHGLRAEIVVADNGSTDGSQRIAEQCGARV